MLIFINLGVLDMKRFGNFIPIVYRNQFIVSTLISSSASTHSDLWLSLHVPGSSRVAWKHAATPQSRLRQSHTGQGSLTSPKVTYGTGPWTVINKPADRGINTLELGKTFPLLCVQHVLHVCPSHSPMGSRSTYGMLGCTAHARKEEKNKNKKHGGFRLEFHMYAFSLEYVNAPPDPHHIPRRAPIVRPLEQVTSLNCVFQEN